MLIQRKINNSCTCLFDNHTYTAAVPYKSLFVCIYSLKTGSFNVCVSTVWYSHTEAQPLSRMHSSVLEIVMTTFSSHTKTYTESSTFHCLNVFLKTDSVFQSHSSLSFSPSVLHLVLFHLSVYPLSPSTSLIVPFSLAETSLLEKQHLSSRLTLLSFSAACGCNNMGLMLRTVAFLHPQQHQRSHTLRSTALTGECEIEFVCTVSVKERQWREGGTGREKKQEFHAEISRLDSKMY